MIKYYLIGEIHGTNECPAACLDILQRHGLTQLALEFEKGYQQEFDEFLEGKRAIDDLSVLRNKYASKDGRCSPAMRQLLLTARDVGIHLYCVDDCSDLDRRDKYMAQNLQLIAPPVGYLCGQTHAAKKEILLDEMSMFYEVYNGVLKPCGAYLPPEETLSYKTVPVEGGTFYNLGPCKVEGNKKLSQKHPDLPTIIPSPEEGYDFWYLVRQFTPST